MADPVTLSACRVCGGTDAVSRASFTQLFPQSEARSVRVPWWSCGTCGAYFAYPVPSVEEICDHWKTVNYNTEANSQVLNDAKSHLWPTVFAHVPTLPDGGRLLDVGSNFGQFLREARDRGWVAAGFEPSPECADVARRAGFEVTVGWELETAGYRAQTFDAITAFDSFCYVWHPHAALATMASLLRPGGVLAMRLSNKRDVIASLQHLKPVGGARDAYVTRLLQNQFHSVSVSGMAKLLRALGFANVTVVRGATTARWSNLTRRSQLAYAAAEAAYFASLGIVTLSPGVLLFAVKGRR